jgi:RNA polymerase sigma factor (sigma-70 family)
VPSKETDQPQDMQRRVQLAKELFIEQGEYIRSVVRYAASGNEYTDDLVHELFLFFAAKPIPDDILNIRGYLYKVIFDKVRDWQRSRTRHQIRLRQYQEEKLKELTTLCREGQEDENAQQIMGLIERHLSRAEIRAIVLRYRNQYEIEEVAMEMNIKPRSVSRYISVGLKKIRQLLNIQRGADHEEGE